MKEFLKVNMASLIATGADFSVAWLAVQCLQFDPLAGNITGTVLGGLVNFLLGRHWAFDAANLPLRSTGFRYLITWMGNLMLNSAGSYTGIRIAGMNYLVTKVITAILVAFCYNYPMQKHYVFRNNHVK